VRLSTEGDEKRAIAEKQVDSALANVCTVSGYIWCYWDLIPESHIADALSVLNGRKPKMIWLDVEDPPSGNVVDWLRRAIKAVQSACYQAGIYTGPWWWNAHLPNITEFAHLPLWVADYNGKASLGDVELFGGWTKAAGHQYAGHTIDLDVFDSGVI
jgi:GH25 family lysozyme M1 (1,4-beta-N-acetylmuramidase)